MIIFLLYLKYFKKRVREALSHYFINDKNLKSNEKIIKYTYDSYCFEFLSDNGVFSKNKIDTGSRTLVEAFFKNKSNIKNFLDVGCGYGFITIVLSKVLNVKGVGLDINERALALASKNAKLNNVSVTFKESDIYKNEEGTYDLIITNPPIRAGKEVVLRILSEASCHLNVNGSLWAVIRKDQGAKSIIASLKNKYKIEIIAKNKGFYVFVAKKN